MFNFFRKIKAIDIAITQADWRTDGYKHLWQVYYFGEPIGEVEYSYLSNRWSIFEKLYGKRRSLLMEKKGSCNIKYGNDELTFEEIKQIRKIKRIFANHLNKIKYKFC